MREDVREAAGGTVRVTVDEAARLLDTTDGAIRKRIHRGSMTSEKDDEGRVWVFLDRADVEGHRDDNRGDGRDDADPLREVHPRQLLESKDETIEVLREALDAERRAHGETRRIAAGLIQRVPELEAAPGDPPGGPQSHQDEPRGYGEGDTPREAQDGTQRRSWWRRMFE